MAPPRSIYSRDERLDSELMRKQFRTNALYLATAAILMGTLGCASSQPPAATPAPPAAPEMESRDVRSEPEPPAEPDPPAATAPAPASVGEGVYTVEQSDRGETAYRRACQSCHTPTLRGGVVIPALAGESFMSKWGRMSVGDLYERIRTTMPPSASRRLTREEYADVVAFIFNKNEFPAGEHELGTEFADLKDIQIQPQ